MHTLAVREFWTIVIGGSVLSMNSGFINAVTLAGIFAVTVSHVTGNLTRMAISVSENDFPTLILVASMVASFMFGSFIAGFMVGDNKFRLGKTYGYALLLEASSLFLAFLFLKKGSVLGELCASFACGLQNALTTSYSGAVIRTTHMTGICTDIGNILGQACRKDTKAELWRLKVHLPLFFSFLFGSVIGQYAYMGMKENAMLLPCFFSGTIGCIYLGLPVLRQAQDKFKEISKLLPGQEAAVEIRRVGDPTKPKGDIFGDLNGKDVDREIDQLMLDMNFQNDPNQVAPLALDKRFTESSDSISVALIPLVTTFNTTTVDGGGSIEVIYTPTQGKRYLK